MKIGKNDAAEALWKLDAGLTMLRTIRMSPPAKTQMILSCNLAFIVLGKLIAASEKGDSIIEFE